MADSILKPGALLHKLLSGEEMDFLREALTAIARQITDVEVQRKTGAACGERSSERLVRRNGYRERCWDTQGGFHPAPCPQAQGRQLLPLLPRTPPPERRGSCRCRLGSLREGGLLPKDAQGMVLAAARLIFQQPDKERACLELRALAARLEERLPQAVAHFLEAEEEILAHMDFPREPWTKLSSTNPLERLNREIARRTRVVGIFPTRASLNGLAGPLLAEQSGEWAVSRRYMSQGSLVSLYANEDDQAGRIITHPVLVPVH